MKGAYFVSEEPRLAELVLAAMQVAGSQVASDGVAQLRDEQSRLFTVFAYPDQEASGDWRNSDITLAEDGLLPDLSALSACWIECRWEDLFAAQVSVLASGLAAQSWVLDGDGVLWPATRVDPAQVRL